MGVEGENEDDVLELGGDETVEAAEGADTIEGGEHREDEAETLELPSFDGDAEDQDGDTERMRQLRATLRETLAENKRLREGNKPAAIEVGEKPTLEGCEYDEDRFEQELTAYHERKRKAEAQANEQTEAQAKAAEAFQAKLSSYAQGRAVYPQAMMVECENAVTAALSDDQKRALLRYSLDPAKLVVALGRSPSKLDALAKSTDIGEFIADMARLDKEVKLAKRTPSVVPSKPLNGGAPLSAPAPSQIEKDLAKAAEKGDMKEVRRLRKMRDERKAA